MESATWADILAQAIFHTLVASLLVEALVRSWGVREPRQRMALRLTALGYPLVLFPALVALFPGRAGEGFREDLAIFDARSWEAVRLLGVGLYWWWLAAFAAVGAALFFMDLLPVLRGRGRRAPEGQLPGAESAAVLDAELPRAAAALGIPEPPVVFLDRDLPVLFCTGVRRPALVVSRGTLARLDRDELRAALAHELAHVAGRDPLKSWILMGLRALMFWNPAFQVVSRALARDAEWLADERGAAACGDRVALASGLLKLHRATGGAAVPRTLPFAAALAEPLARVRSHDIEVRCRRLLDGAPARLPYGGARVALAGAGLTALLFFVV
ncbi:M56 family metallopeptidase [Anaeromyxobacter sp. Fw109-5]|uniref:M56 family metallopeptidase n=1 Tax=Anaeromyxobacter sp. (strain Fw109-5) TaxID=404589 RepID=UPI000158A694|nr:M56 family metallopeptidase [Anaeromyxobacter sp. Fw109-5]ABS26010.1 peptidase M56 BlaR1 [Anaeromyxobacter sp. Fw109-5]